MDRAPLHVFSDFDGTISEPDTLMFLTERFGAGPAHYRETGELLRAGRLTLREGVARDIGSLRVPFAEAARALATGVALDPAFVPFARWCAAEGVPLTVLSGGFTEIITLFLPAAEFPALDVRANRLRPGTWECVFRDDSPFGHDKAAAIQAARRRGARTVFVGDGFSDREAAGVADVVFARRGRNLVEYCRRRDIPCHEFTSFDNVLGRVRAGHERAA